MMDEYYRYEYEDNGQYCYPHTHVLKNKLDIRDKDELFKVEQELSSARYFEISQRPIPGDFSLEHLCAIHRYLFQDIIIIILRMWITRQRWPISLPI